MPVVMLKSAWSPSAVLNPGNGASGTAPAFGKRGRQTSAVTITTNIRFGFFIDVGCPFIVFGAFVISPKQGEKSASAPFSHFLRKPFAKDAAGVSTRK